MAKKLFREWLGIIARDRQRQQIFDQLVIEQRFAALVKQPARSRDR